MSNRPGPPGKVVAKVSQIAIYPVKGCGGIALRIAEVLSSGLKNDRGYMIVREEKDQEGVHPFITQRDKRGRSDAKPQSLSILALIRPQIIDGGLRLTWKGTDPVVVNPEQRAGRLMMVRVQKDVVWSVDQGEQVARWLSEHLEVRVRLVGRGARFHRLASQTYMRSTNTISFQDAYPIHWVMQESVDELSKVARKEIPWTRFRPNIVGEGGEPQAEHTIHEGIMGQIRFIQPKPCTRCPVTTVDQQSGEKRGNEPLTALSTYKRWQKTREIIFGENVLPIQAGTVSIGDDIVQLTERRPPIVYGR